MLINIALLHQLEVGIFHMKCPISIGKSSREVLDFSSINLIYGVVLL